MSWGFAISSLCPVPPSSPASHPVRLQKGLRMMFPVGSHTDLRHQYHPALLPQPIGRLARKVLGLS